MSIKDLTGAELFAQVAKARGWIITADIPHFTASVAVELFNQYGLDARRFGDLTYVTISKGGCVKTEEAPDFETAVFRAFVSASKNGEPK